MSAERSSIEIAGAVVEQVNGLFLMRDLHKASGEPDHKRPSVFLRNASSIALIEEYGSDQIVKKEGRGGGVWAGEGIVCAYAMWLNPKFYRKVVDTFLSVAKGDLHGAAHLADTEASRAAGMRLAMSALSADRLFFSREEKAAAALDAASACMDKDTLHKRIKTEVEIIISRCLPAKRGISKNALVESVSGTGLFVLGSHVDERFVQVVMEEMEEAGLLQYDGPLVRVAE